MNIPREALAQATDEQLIAFRDNVLKNWQHVPDEGISVWTEFGGTLMVALKHTSTEGRNSTFVVGIEPDGYTHS